MLLSLFITLCSVISRNYLRASTFRNYNRDGGYVRYTGSIKVSLSLCIKTPRTYLVSLMRFSTDASALKRLMAKESVIKYSANERDKAITMSRAMSPRTRMRAHAHLYILAAVDIEEIKGNLISHVVNARRRAECTYLNETPHEILRERRDSGMRRCVVLYPRRARNQVYRVVPETSKTS